MATFFLVRCDETALPSYCDFHFSHENVILNKFNSPPIVTHEPNAAG